MTYYKSYRIIDGKPRWIIVDETGKIINRSPSKDELKGLEKETYVRNIVSIFIYYNKTNTCGKCGEKLVYGKTRREIVEGNWTGIWICNKCHNNYDSNSISNIIKSLRDHRTNNLDPNCTSAKGDNFQELTVRWRSTVSTIHIEDLNKKLDNYTTPIDHSWDSELGIIQTKGKLYDSYNQHWAQNFITEHNTIRRGLEFDYLIFYCASEDGKTIERIYIIPKEEIKDKRKGITIVKNLIKRGCGWYEQYRIKDEETIKKINDIWKEIIDNRT